MGQSRLAGLARVAALIFVAMALQTLVASQVSVLGLTMDIFVIFTVIVAASWGPLPAAVFGFFAGLAADIAYREPLGMRALVCVLTGYSLGVLAGRFRATRPRTIFLYTLGASFFAKVVLGLFEYVMGPREGFFTMLGTQMIPGAALDALVAVPIYLLLLKLRVVSAPKPEPSSGGGVTA